MKARFFFLAALLFGLAACQTEPEGLDVNVGGEQLVTVNVTVPEAETRADAGSDSAAGAFVNGVLGTADDNTTMRYILQVYLKTGEDVYVQSAERLVEYSDGKKVNFEVRLVPGRNYQFVVWADVVTDGKNDTDNHYVTKDAEGKSTLETITLKGEWNAMDESRDAYTATEYIDNYSGAKDIDITLKRPFSKLRVVTTDIKNLTNLGIVPTTATVEYTTNHRLGFNALTGKAADASETKTHTYTIAQYTNETNTGAEYTLFTDYFFAENDVVKFNFDVRDAKGVSINSHTFNTDIYVKRNYLTTIKGNILTENNSFEVTIDDAFDIPENEVDADVKAELEEAANYKNYVIDLKGDLIWETGAAHGSTPLIPEGAVTETLTINGNGYKLIATGTGVGAIRMANGGKLILNDLTVVDQSEYHAENGETAWEFTYLEFAGETEFNNCVIDNTVALDGTKAVFNNCTFNDKETWPANVGQEYAAWVSNGIAHFNNCSFSGSRGIKVHEAYGSEVAEVVVDNCEFNNLSKKPGMAIGDVNAETKIEIKNSTFTNCQPGDQGFFVYETDTDVATFDFSQTNNTVNAVIASSEVFAKALKADIHTLNISLNADVTVDISANSAGYLFGGNNTNVITINGAKVAAAAATGAGDNTYTLTFNHKNSDWNYIRFNNDNAKWVIKNVKLTNSGYNNGPWNRHDISFYNDVELVNVTSDKAIALFGDSDLTNVIISDVHSTNSDAYALWIRPFGQTVNIKDCAFLAHESKSGDRGIKIDNQYIDEGEAKVTLNVDGLKVKSQKKAAIVVKSTTGADINVQNIDLSEVAADTKNAVWVDSAAAEYAALVNVSGASMFTEGATIVEGDDAIGTIENNSVVYLGEGEFVIPNSAQGKTVKFIGTGAPEDTQVAVTKVGTGGENCDYSLDGSNVTFENITITTNSSTYIGYARCNGTYKNCIINGTYTLYGDSVFEDCTFNVTGDVYNIWTWGAPTATFENCTFNCDGKAMLLYGQSNTKLTMNNCTFNDKGGLVDELKAAIEIGNDYNKSYELTVNNATVNGFAVNPNGIVTGTTLWANKNSMPADKLKVTVDGYNWIVGYTWVADGVMNADNEYFISKAAGLTWFSDQMNNKKNTFAGKTIKIVNDIDMAGVTYYGGSVASYPSYSFKGTFDGGEKVISNLTITVENDVYGAAALIPTLSGDGTTVKNVILKDVNISSSHYAAGIWGYTTSNNSLINVTNCHVEGGTITGNFFINSEGKADNADKVGGIGGIFYTGIVDGCSVKDVTISGYRDTAGIVGWAANSNATIKNNVIENVTINVNNASNYKKYTKRAEYDVNSYVGEGVGKAILEGNTGEATINWGSIAE